MPLPCHAMPFHSITRYDTTRHDTTRHCTTVQYNTIQYNTIQYNTIQYNTIQYNTTHYIFSHHITSHHITLHCIALHCIALHCIALHCTALHCTALHCIAFHHVPFRSVTLQYITLHHIALHNVTLRYGTVTHMTVRETLLFFLNQTFRWARLREQPQESNTYTTLMGWECCSVGPTPPWTVHFGTSPFKKKTRQTHAFETVSSPLSPSGGGSPRHADFIKVDAATTGGKESQPMFFGTPHMLVSQSAFPAAVISSAEGPALSFAHAVQPTSSTCNQHVCYCSDAWPCALIQDRRARQTVRWRTFLLPPHDRTVPI